MKRALIIGASGGIGSAMAAELRAAGTEVTGLSRRDHGLDVTDPASVARLMGAFEAPFDLVLIATGILAPDGSTPEKSLAAVDAAVLARVLAVNTIGPALILRELPRLLPRDQRSVTGLLTARVGSIGDNRLGGWYAYRASKAAAHQIVRTAAIEFGRTHPGAIVAALHPGTVATPLTAGYPAHSKVPAEEAARNLLSVTAGLTPVQSGGFFDYSGAELPW